jgi:hypothetical protein
MRLDFGRELDLGSCSLCGELIFVESAKGGSDDSPGCSVIDDEYALELDEFLGCKTVGTIHVCMECFEAIRNHLRIVAWIERVKREAWEAGRAK